MNLERRTEFILGVKQYAIDELGIPDNDSFLEMYPGGKVHAVYHALPNRLEPAIKKDPGCQIFDDEQEAREFARSMRKEGYHAMYTTFCSYSKNEKNGEAPLTTNLLKEDRVYQSYIIFHEMFHLHCTVNKIVSNRRLDLEEALADTFAYCSQREYFADDTVRFKQIKTRRDRVRELNDFYAKYIALLREKGADTEKILARANKEQHRHKIKHRLNMAFFLRESFYAPYYGRAMDLFDHSDPRDLVANTRECYRQMLEK